MEAIWRSRSSAVCGLHGRRSALLLAQRLQGVARSFKDDSHAAASGKPGQFRGTTITFKTPGTPQPPAPIKPASEQVPDESELKALPAPSASLSKGAKSAIDNLPSPSAASDSEPSGPAPATLPPPAVYAKLASMGGEKANLPFGKLVLLSVLAGMYISFGGLLMLSVGTCCPGLAATNPGLQRLVQGLIGLPFGLICVVFLGAELFTGNVLYMTAAFWEKKASAGQVLKNWIVSYLGNFVGTVLIVKLVALTGLAIAAPSAVKVSGVKTSLPFVQALTRGILGNWLVCIAVWQSVASSSFSGKIIGIMLTISSFVAMGFEHSVANMFMIPLGIASGANFTFSHFLSSNLLPVSLGNIIGGAIFLGTPSAFAYGRKHAQQA